MVETEGKRLERGSSRRRPRPQAASKGLRERFFVGLLDGAEKREWILLRQRLFTKTWAQMDERIQVGCRPPPWVWTDASQLGRTLPSTGLAAMEQKLTVQRPGHPEGFQRDDAAAGVGVCGGGRG